jgi:hypothetical protein
VAHESPYIEFKESVKDKEDIKRKILENVTAFLNSRDGRGFIVFGVKGKDVAEKVACIPKGIIRDSENIDTVESFIRDSILAHLKSIPKHPASPFLSIKIFDCRVDCNVNRDGWVVIIYVEKRADAVYYSDIDDSAHIREGSRSRRLKLEEILQHVESKKKPIVRILLKPNVENLQQLKLKFMLNNIGFKPANYLSAIVKINKLIEVLTSTGKSLTKIKYNTSTFSIAKLQEDDNSIIIGILHHLSQGGMPIFPGLLGSKGEILITLENPLPEKAKIKFNFSAEIFTEETMAWQQCEVQLSDRVEQLCSIFVQDYLGNIIFNSTIRENL